MADSLLPEPIQRPIVIEVADLDGICVRSKPTGIRIGEIPGDEAHDASTGFEVPFEPLEYPGNPHRVRSTINRHPFCGVPQPLTQSAIELLFQPARDPRFPEQ